MALAACGVHGPSFEGRVMEVLNFDQSPTDWAYKPLGNVQVIVIWNGDYLSNPVDSELVCLLARRVRSGEDGRFKAAGWWRLPDGRLIGAVEPHSYAYLPGFTEVHPRDVGDVVWMPAKGFHVFRREPGNRPELPETEWSNIGLCPTEPPV